MVFSWLVQLLYTISTDPFFHRFFASEIIRGSLFCKLGKELPYCCEVRIDEFVEPKSPVPSKSGVDDPHTKRLIRIKATIHVERDSQKSIVIGKGGEKIKEVGMDARVKLEEFLQEKVHLDLFVKVDRDWRKNEAKLKAYGYLR
jgi:GTP-binding protein Era